MDVKLPKTDPLWIDQRIMDNQPLTSAEDKIAKDQTEALTKTLDILHQPVAKGDVKAANKKAADLQKHFESLPPDTKKFLYNQLQSKTGSGIVDHEIAGQFRYYLESGQRDKLLKTLNPDHKKDEIQKYTLNDARQKELEAVAKNKQEEMERKMKEIDEAKNK